LPFRPLPFAEPESPPGPASAAVDVYIARPPIYDEANRRVAHELPYRGSAGAISSGADTAGPSIDDQALHAVVSIGLERLAADATAFANLTRAHLVDEAYRLLHPKCVVLEQQHTAEALAPHVARLRALGLIVLAERVETDADRSRCRSMGCTLFQGYVYSRPETIAGRSLSIHQATLLQLVSMLGDEAVLHALVRARLSELVAITVGAPDPGAHLLVGLLSELDVLLGIPMAGAIGRLPLGADVREAVLHRTGPLGAVLVLVAAWQRADWDALPPLLAAASVPAVVVAGHFVAATEWAGERLSMALS
jgi:c-di-GMP-related signal transduction protein